MRVSLFLMLGLLSGTVYSFDASVLYIEKEVFYYLRSLYPNLQLACFFFLIDISGEEKISGINSVSLTSAYSLSEKVLKCTEESSLCIFHR